MPELPEVEVLRRSLLPFVCGKKIKDSYVYYDKAFPNFSKLLLQEKKISNITRRGKYLCIHLQPSGFIVVHLRMTGKIIYSENRWIEKHNHIKIDLENGYLYYNDVRKFGGFFYYEQLSEVEKALSHLGFEPLDDRFTGKVLYDLTRNKEIPLKRFLLDQSKLCGLGNIYVDETLFRAKLHPLKKIRTLTQKECETLVLEIKTILTEAICLGGSSIKDYKDALGKSGNYQTKHKVYGRAGLECFSCQTPLEKMLISGRTTVYCPRCQRKG